MTRPFRSSPAAVAWAVALTASFAASAGIARADIFQWQYINPADPTKGKQQSTTLCPDGGGAIVAQATDLSNRNLTKAYMIGFDLSAVPIYDPDTGEISGVIGSKLTGVNLSLADLTGANLGGATLTNANFTAAEIRGAILGAQVYPGFGGAGTGITAAQLVSTASYQAHDLTGVGLAYSGLDGINLSNQNLTSASLIACSLQNAMLTQAKLVGVSLDGANLLGANLSGADATAAAFSGANLTNANLSQTKLQAFMLTATVTGANFTGADIHAAYLPVGLTAAQLYSTASYQNHDLTGIVLSGNSTQWNFANQNLTNASLFNSTVTDANFNGAIVRGADLPYGFTPTQLYSTGSYQGHDLRGITLNGLFNGTNLTGQNLTNAQFHGFWNNVNFSHSNLTGAVFDGTPLANSDFTEADLTGAMLPYGVTPIDATGTKFSHANLVNSDFHQADLANATLTAADARGAAGLLLPPSAVTTNLIRPDGRIAGLDLTAGASLLIRDYDGNPTALPSPTGPIPIVVDQHFTAGPTGTLEMLFDADPWDSTISFAPGIPVTLGGTLQLDFAGDVDLTTQLGRTIDVFDWAGVTPTGTFNIQSPYSWDTSKLYTTGDITLVPEPSSLGLLALMLPALLRRRCRR
jgi:uncharacterized protein YjbI with pentapeptide repeats